MDEHKASVMMMTEGNRSTERITCLSDNLPTKQTHTDWNGFEPVSRGKIPTIARQTSYCIRTEINSINKLKISMKDSRSGAANISSSNQHIPHTSRNPKVHFRVNNSPLLVHSLYFHLMHQLNAIILHDITVISH
jgi:hypothetical protein